MVTIVKTPIVNKSNRYLRVKGGAQGIGRGPLSRQVDGNVLRMALVRQLLAQCLSTLWHCDAKPATILLTYTGTLVREKINVLILKFGMHFFHLLCRKRLLSIYDEKFERNYPPTSMRISM